MVSSRALATRLLPIIEDDDLLSPRSSAGSTDNPQGLSIDSSELDDVSSLGDSTFQTMSKSRSSKLLKRLEMRKKLYGRDEQVTKLREAYDRISETKNMQSPSGHSEAVFISGEAGAGKSLLLDVGLREYVAKTKDGFFVSGKYCQLQSRTPYAAIVESFTDLVDLIVQEGGDTMYRVQRAMKRELGTNAKTMVSLIPNLSRLTGETYLKEDQLGLQGGKLFVLFKRLCRAFLRAVSMSGHPIVMFIDDIQWAERQSLEVLECILSDPDSGRVLVVCSFRSDEDSMHHDLVSFLDELDALSTRTTYLELENLPLKEINRIVSEQTGVPFQKTLKLSRLVHRRTKGNCYFVIQFLEQLERNEYIYYSQARKKWTWDIHVIEANTSATENVVRVLEEKVSGLKAELQALLKLCSYIGHSFGVEDVTDIIAKRNSADLRGTVYNALVAYVCQDDRRLGELLSIGEMQGFIEKVSPSRYRWTHDKVQTCLYSVAQDDGNYELLHYWIGSALWEKARLPEGEEVDIFNAAFHLNRCHDRLVGSFQRTELAKLNINAAKISLRKSAFSSASSSLVCALTLLDEATVWTTHYSLALELYTFLAEASYVGGDSQRTADAIDTVLGNATSREHKLRVYDIKMEMLSSRGEHTAAVDEGFALLRLLGERFPKKISKVDVACDLIKMKVTLCRKSNSAILSLPTCRNKKKVEAMRILSTVASIVYLKSSEAMPFALVTLRLLKLSFKYGTSDMSPHGFACFAVLLAALGSHGQAYRYGCLCRDLLGSMHNKAAESRTTLALSHFVFHWREPASTTGFLHGYQCGMATGDLNSAFMSYSGALLLDYYMAEVSLVDIEHRLRSAVDLMIEYQQYSSARMALPYHQYVLNMLGRSQDPCVLEGEAMDKIASLPQALKPDLSVAIRGRRYASLVLAYNFDRVDLLEPLIQEVVALPPAKGHYIEHMFELWKGLVYLRLYQTTRKRVFRVRAEKITKQVRKWLDEGVVSCHPRYLLLNAIHVSLRGNCEETERAFDMAIQAGVQSHNLHLQALANERAVDFFESRDSKTAQIYLNQARVLYHKFGFQTKVTLLSNKYPNLV